MYNFLLNRKLIVLWNDFIGDLYNSTIRLRLCQITVKYMLYLKLAVVIVNTLIPLSSLSLTTVKF